MTRRGRFTLAGVILAGALSASCTEQPLGSDGPGDAPGATVPTLEFVVPVEDFPMWRDTTVSGFVTPQDGSFLIQADQDELRSRVLGRFAVPDTIATFTDTLPPEEFVDANVFVRIDSTRSTFPEAPLELRLHALRTPFDAAEASWQEARAGMPWMTPGGDLGAVLGRAELDMISDTALIRFEVPVDSLLMSWIDEGEPGFAIVTDAPGSRLQITRIRLRFDVILEGRETAIASEVLVGPVTFIADPPQPATGLALRLGGLPASRSYFNFVPPDTIEGVPVRGSAVNHAELQFVPLESPEGAYRLERTTVARPIVLLGDPFDFGEKTPIGPGFNEFLPLQPGELEAGNILRVNITRVMDAQALLPPDSVRAVQLGIRGEPDGQSFGFWEFGSIEAPPGMRPRMVIVITPRPDFRLP